MSHVRYDEIGYWSEIKLDIIRDYAKEYSKVLQIKSRFAGTSTLMPLRAPASIYLSALATSCLEVP